MDAGSATVPSVDASCLTFIQVTGLVHDLGKLLLLFGSEGQWDVVGVSALRLAIVDVVAHILSRTHLVRPLRFASPYSCLIVISSRWLQVRV